MAKLHLQDKEGLISSLKLQLSCAAGNAKADLELEMEKNKAFSARITSFENAVADVSRDRDDVEEANRKLHELVSQLRNENIQLRAKLEETEMQLEVCEIARAEDDHFNLSITHTIKCVPTSIRSTKGPLAPRLKFRISCGEKYRQ
ncbi:PREDICTED: uncharacterized protein LOC107355414 [Acropora digitifera]|uniref:uncharacterized protein LOC107355414 n=1 Tax=Acropora digitifera TaxID=70779 RepID=UPI00077A2362|nr:PREDICTED: uncharacterized protein LOC107355414 [Acropora digitifera]